MSDEKAERAFTEEETPQPVTIAEFLESRPPNQNVEVADLVRDDIKVSGRFVDTLNTPELALHCSTCNGTRFFRSETSYPKVVEADRWYNDYIGYRCSNCRKTGKLYSISFCLTGDKSGSIRKFGEYPEFGPPTPSRLIKLVGPDRALFLQGRRCENQGLGIGAFSYYRRVVEAQKNRIIDEIIKVSEKLGFDDVELKELKAARDETQFSTALGTVKQGIPQALLINGHNPLSLLHSALSDGLHERSDAECLETAQDVRIILVELAERLSQAMKDEAELNKAVARLAAAKDGSSKQSESK